MLEVIIIIILVNLTYCHHLVSSQMQRCDARSSQEASDADVADSLVPRIGPSSGLRFL